MLGTYDPNLLRWEEKHLAVGEKGFVKKDPFAGS